MALDIVWTVGALEDLTNIYGQFFAATNGDENLLARFLLMPLESSLTMIRNHPQISPRVRKASRLRKRLLSPQNRYGLFYAVENRGIIIHALLDLRQDPESIRKRLGEF
jgi:hypothetical protein